MLASIEGTMCMIARDIEHALDLTENLTPNGLADVTGINRKTVRRILNKEVETDFCNLLSISNELFEDDNTLIQWCYTFERPANVCAAMEYMSITKRTKELYNYIEFKVEKEMKGKKNLKKWGHIYKLMAEYEDKPLDHKEILKNIRSVLVEDFEMGVLLRILEAYICYRILSDDSSYLKEMARICDEVKNDINSIKECFMKKSLKLRLNDLIAKSELFVKADVSTARKYANKNINQDFCAILRANAYYLLARSFTFESCEERIRYTKLAIEEYKRAGYLYLADDLENLAIPFIEAHYGVRPSENEEGIAYFEAKWGDKEIAKTLIDEIIRNKGTNMYRIYYKGLAENNDQLLMESMSQFLKVGDNFFAQLPLEHLRASKNPIVSTLSETVYNEFTK
jgi:hypothetical protein